MPERHPGFSNHLPPWLGPALAAVLALAPASGCRRVESKVVANRPLEVIVNRPVEGEVTDYEDFTGRAEAMQSVEVRARVTGYLEKVHFEDGTEVKQGDLLFEIDSRPYDVEVDRTEAALAQANAAQKRAEVDYQRSAALFNRNSLSREEYEIAAATLAEARAGVGVALAARDRARLDKAWTQVRAPISGRISRTMVDPGNLVTADVTPLTTIVTLDPMYVYFDVDERTLLRLRRLVREGKIQSRAESEIPFLAALADEDDYVHSGVINFSDNRVEPTTGTLQVRGVIPNPKPYVLSPGLFVRVRLQIGKPHPALMIAEQALGTDQGRKFVYVVTDANEVVYRSVTVGSVHNGLRVVEEGLKPGERVIVTGTQRVRPGAKVLPKLMAATPDANAPPSPGSSGSQNEEKPAPAARKTAP